MQQYAAGWQAGMAQGLQLQQLELSVLGCRMVRCRLMIWCLCVCLLFIHWVRAAGAGAPILITTSLQVDDLALLKAYKKKRAVRLPLSAQNKKQWDEELRLTARDARRLERAQAWAAAEHR